MRPQITLQPIHNSSVDILRCFATGAPLSCDQIHLLEWHERELSNPLLDPVLKYYLESLKKRKRDFRSSFLLPHEIINHDSIEQLKKRIHLFLKEKNIHAVLRFTENEFTQFKQLTQQELVIWHGNSIKPESFFPEGLPAVLYFEWDHLFCAVKYVIIPDGNIVNSDLLIYFEDMQDRDLNRCVEDYKNSFHNEIILQQNIMRQNLEKSSNESELKLHDYYLINHI